MPAQTITHKFWCREHQTDYEGEHCHVGYEFGRMNPATAQFAAHPKGDVWAAQQLGVDNEPTVCIEYGGGGGLTMKVEDLLPLRKAVDGLLEAFDIE